MNFGVPFIMLTSLAADFGTIREAIWDSLKTERVQ